MRRRTRIFVLLAALASLKAQAPKDRIFDTRSVPVFNNPPPALQDFLRTQHTSGQQHFCIIGYQGSTKADRSKRAWIHWTEGRKIILWTGGPIARSRRVIDLTKDVVATDSEVKGSTNLVTRAWVNRVVVNCQSHGAKYQIKLK